MKCVSQGCKANLQTTADTDTAVEAKSFHKRTGDAGEHFASGVTLQDTNVTPIKNIKKELKIK